MSRSKKMSQTFFFLLLTLSLLFQAGCAFKDIDKRILVVGIGIDPSDKVKNGFQVTLKLAQPIGSIKQQETPVYAYLTHDSESVAEAIHDMRAQVDKVLEFGHNKVIIINEKLLSQDLETFMDYFTRRGDIQMISYVGVAEESAKDIISFEPITEAPASVSLHNFFGYNGTDSPYVITNFLFRFRREVLSQGIHTVLPLVEVDKENHTFIINKSVVLKDKEEPVRLTMMETKYLNSLLYHASGFSYKVKENGWLFILNIDEVKMKYKIVLDEGAPRIDMKITKVGIIGESNKRLSIEELEKYDEIAAEDIKKEVLELLTKLQENKVDPFGFGLRYRATRLSRDGLMEEWNRIYPEIEFNVMVDVKLKGVGAVE
ncbi:Ger(x)C family spore germination protein [Sporosarcina sp. FSL W8-0480]|uniref:Ger(x)C family spore germination protein n=1 Tax=Sporosarcina sp. FSL W8-0480 TaxID=2954701 RepID=UPI0030D72A2E